MPKIPLARVKWAGSRIARMVSLFVKMAKLASLKRLVANLGRRLIAKTYMNNILQNKKPPM